MVGWENVRGWGVVCAGTEFVVSVLRGFGWGVLLTPPPPALLSGCPVLCSRPPVPRACPAPCPGPSPGGSAVAELHLVPAAAEERGRPCPRIPGESSWGQRCRPPGPLLQLQGKENNWGRFAILSYSLGFQITFLLISATVRRESSNVLPSVFLIDLDPSSALLPRLMVTESLSVCA